jgi:predicted Zn-dependent protease
MHTFEVSHVDICSNMSPIMREKYPGSHQVVKLCRPLLESLKMAYDTNDLKASILEVIKVDVANHTDFEFVFEYCRCKTEQAIKNKAKLELELKRLVAEQHDLEFDA